MLLGHHFDGNCVEEASAKVIRQCFLDDQSTLVFMMTIED